MMPEIQHYQLNGLCLRTVSADRPLIQRIDALFSPFAAPAGQPDIYLELGLVDRQQDWQPAGQVVSRSAFLQVALDGPHLSAYFPRWGTITVNLAEAHIRGLLLPEALSHYGAFDDMLIIALGPLLRRRGFYTLHAFAAAHRDQAVLLVGDIGAGKTTTGLSLLEAGWKLVSNDSPLLSQHEEGIFAHAYPGLLAAYDDTLARFPSLHLFMGQSQETRVKRAFAAHEAYAHIWQTRARAALLLFPTVVPELAASEIKPMSQPEALLSLMPNSIERWDRDYIGPHLAILQGLVKQAPAHRLLLAPDVPALPGLMADLLDHQAPDQGQSY